MLILDLNLESYQAEYTSLQVEEVCKKYSGSLFLLSVFGLKEPNFEELQTVAFSSSSCRAFVLWGARAKTSDRHLFYLGLLCALLGVSVSRCIYISNEEPAPLSASFGDSAIKDVISGLESVLFEPGVPGGDQGMRQIEISDRWRVLDDLKFAKIVRVARLFNEWQAACSVKQKLIERSSERQLGVKCELADARLFLENCVRSCEGRARLEANGFKPPYSFLEAKNILDSYPDSRVSSIDSSRNSISKSYTFIAAVLFRVGLDSSHDKEYSLGIASLTRALESLFKAALVQARVADIVRLERGNYVFKVHGKEKKGVGSLLDEVKQAGLARHLNLGFSEEEWTKEVRECLNSRNNLYLTHGLNDADKQAFSEWLLKLKKAVEAFLSKPDWQFFWSVVKNTKHSRESGPLRDQLMQIINSQSARLSIREN